jgi:5'-nucleotidase
MLILITNDDGVFAPGIITLAGAMRDLGRVVVVAPDREKSAASHSLTLHHPLRIDEIEEDRYSVDGTPTDCVHLAVHVILAEQKPDLLVSGINSGGNLGQDITYSGTVWAAQEGNLMGIPSMAISLVDDRYSDYRPSALFATRMAGWIRDRGLPDDTILNVNVPDDPEQDLDRYVITHQGYHRFEESVVKNTDPRGRSYYWIGGQKLPYRGGIETDVGAVSAGFISVTPLHADMTRYEAMESLRYWKGENG